jgi:hypothetical protein
MRPVYLPVPVATFPETDWGLAIWVIRVDGNRYISPAIDRQPLVLLWRSKMPIDSISHLVRCCWNFLHSRFARDCRVQCNAYSPVAHSTTDVRTWQWIQDRCRYVYKQVCHGWQTTHIRCPVHLWLSVTWRTLSADLHAKTRQPPSRTLTDGRPCFDRWLNRTSRHAAGILPVIGAIQYALQPLYSVQFEQPKNLTVWYP